MSGQVCAQGVLLLRRVPCYLPPGENPIAVNNNNNNNNNYIEPV
jgi:hypothetical protein